MVLSIILCGFLGLVLLVFVYQKNDKKYWQSRGVLTKPAHILLGHLAGVAKSLHMAERQNEFYHEFKGKDKFCGIYLLNRPIAVITDLELVHAICVKDFSKFHDRGIYVNEKSDPLSPHLFSLSGAKWNYLRNKLSPTFTSGKLKLMFPTIVSIADNMQKEVAKQITSNNKTIDVKRICVRYTTDVVSSTVFGLETKTIENDDAKILEITKLMVTSSVGENFKKFFMNSFQTIAFKFGMKIFPKTVAKYFMTIMSETIQCREKNLVKRKDFIDILIKIKNSITIDENNNEDDNFVGKITFNELVATAFDFFFAGFETSSTAMSFCLLQLALNQDIQTRLHNEIHSVLNKCNGRLTYESVCDMTYLEQCFNEALRLFPPAHTLIRETTEDYKVAGTDHVLEKGIQIFISAYSIHRDDTIYSDPLKFDPDRFMPENIKSRHPCAFLPFGEGPRMCIAMRFAMLQSKLGLVSILSNYRVIVNAKTKLPVELEVDNSDMGVRGGIWLDFEKINLENLSGV